MDFSTTPRRAPAENMLPMINVVFLLLIFFLISAQLAPPEPFPVEPPLAEAEDPADGTFTLFLSSEGTLGFRDAEGDEAAVAALVTERDEYCAAAACEGEGAEAPVLVLRADAAVPAEAVARLMPVLGEAGFTSLSLVTAAR